MKTLLASLWKRRWCRFVGVGLILFALPLLDSFVRQSIFGPTIQGIPWCVWEDEIRIAAEPARRRPSWFRQFMEDRGLLKPQGHFGLGRNTAGLPVHLHLADDANVEVRRIALDTMCLCLPKHQTEVLPVLRRHLQDSDTQCQLISANGIWQATKEIEMKTVALPLIDHTDLRIRSQAIYLLIGMAEADGELFDPLSKLAGDADPRVRNEAMRSMRNFGQRGVPILRRAFGDPDKFVRSTAVSAATALGKDGAALYPDLIVLQNDPDPFVRRSASHGLYTMDPKQFPKPATWID